MDSVTMGMKLDELYHGMALPSKFKIGVSGCPNCCGESWIKDLGLIGTPKGWKIVVGGCAGALPMIAQAVADGLNDEQAIEVIDKIISYYKKHYKKERIGKLISNIGIESFKKEAGI